MRYCRVEKSLSVDYFIERVQKKLYLAIIMDWEKISFKADENSPLPKYQQIAREIEAVIRTSRLAPGTKLPGNRLLADCFHTTAVTIGKALDGLAARGLIECRHQSGTYVCDTALPGSRG